jgi:hypothetical protein
MGRVTRWLHYLLTGRDYNHLVENIQDMDRYEEVRGYSQKFRG